MTILRKCLGVSTLAVLALAFCSLIIGQAAIANADRIVAENADKSFENAVPLPTAYDRGSPSGSALSDDPLGAEARAFDEGSLDEMALMRKLKRSTPTVADGIPKGVGDDISDPIIVGDQTALPWSQAGDNSTGTDTHQFSPDCYGANYGDATADYWYQFSPTVDMRLNITTCNSTEAEDLAMMVFDGDIDTPILCVDDACGVDAYQPAIGAFVLTGGHDYYIMIDGWAGTPYVLELSEYVPHEDFATAKCAEATQHEAEDCGERINGGCYGNWPDVTNDRTTGEDVIGDFKDVLLCGTLDLNPDIDPESPGIRSGIERDADQWNFEVEEVTKLTVECGSEIALRFFLHIFDGPGLCPSTAAPGNWTVNKAEIMNEVVVLFPGSYAFSLRANVEVLGCGEGDYGDPRYYIETGFIPLTSIDDCPLALDIAGEAGDGVTDGTPFIQDMCPMTSDGLVYHPWYDAVIPLFGNAWYRWECMETGIYTMSMCNTPNVDNGEGPETYDLYMAVWPEGCPTDPQAQLTVEGGMEDGDNCAPGWEPEVEFIAAEGLFYLISVASWNYYAGLNCGDAWLEISHVELPLYADDCDGTGDAAPFVITKDTIDVFVNNLNADTDGPDDTFCSTGSLGGDIWFQVTAWADGYITVDFLEMLWDSNLEVYEGHECLAMFDPRQPIRCNDDYGDPDGYFAWPGDNVWPQPGHGSWASWPVQEGEEYLLRLGGWYDPPANPLAVGGMGYGDYSIWISENGPGPANDFCADAVPTVIEAGVTTTFEGDTYWATMGDCDLGYEYTSQYDGPVWEAFTIPEGPCMDVTIDFCDSPASDGSGGWDWNRADNSDVAPNREGMNVWYTGCPCDGVVGIQSSSSFWNTEGCDLNNGHNFTGLPAGDYYVQVDFMAHGQDGPWDYYVLNVTGTETDCVYCVADPNIASCPPVAGASWVSGVYLADMSNGGESEPVDLGTGCNSYENFSDPLAPDYPGPAHLYRGMEYLLTIDMGKQGTADYAYDRCDAWMDWNQNSSFYNVGERYTPERSALQWTTLFTPPLDALLPGEGATGTTIMRVRMASVNDGLNVPCGTSTWGEVEDYLIELMDLEIGDFDDPPDGVIDAEDIQFLMDWYFTGEGGPDFWQRADLDGDGEITIADIIALVDLAYGA